MADAGALDTRIVKKRVAGLPSATLATILGASSFDRYNANSPVAANLLFGTPIGSVFKGGRLAAARPAPQGHEELVDIIPPLRP
ncbi:MAG: hypothetical protein JO282_13460 [Alphaproteobacteria bacterium]|nr:hypothetical protein [Alphaproteobacteria bacterium]